MHLLSIFFTILFACISFPVESVQAETLGEITQVEPDGTIQFYSGNVTLAEGEELRIGSGFGSATYFLKVTKTNPPYSHAQVVRLQGGGYGIVNMIAKGQKVVLEVDPNDVYSAGFFVGTNSFPQVQSFGGHQWGIGLLFTVPVFEQLFADFRLQADSMGKDGNGIEKRRAAYMVGIGTRQKGFLISANIGSIDTMTITTDVANASSKYDPFTGATYPTQGVLHSDQFAYRIAAGYPIMLKQISRNNKTGFALTPTLSYLDTFSSSAYKGYWSLGVSIDMVSR